MSVLQKNPKKSVEFINTVMNKKALNQFLSKIFLEYGTAKTAYLANILKDLGFKYATKAGTTISIDDLDVPKTKKDLLRSAEEEIDKATQRYLKGEITEVERYTKVIDTWSETTEKLTQIVVENFDRLNPVYMMAFSGARGNISQVSQLVGMRGLMADAQGQIIDLPIKSNFKEGLNVTEYIISSYGARKGLVDTALKTADSGYLTRRLVDVAQDVIIRNSDCKTSNGIEMSAISEGDKVYVTLEERLLGRTNVADIKDKDGTVIVPADTLLNRDHVNLIVKEGIKKVKVRSALTCDLEYGICQKCYGWALTSNKIVDIGEAIGIIAAQSIGEPGTQLTMRTFHTGGVFKGASNVRQIKSEVEGKIISKLLTREVRTRHGNEVEVSVKDGTIQVEDKKGKAHSYKVPYGATIFVKSGETVKKGTAIAEFEPGLTRGEAGRLTEKATKDITSDISGKVVFDGFSVDEKRDRQGNISRTANKGGKVWVLSGDVYNLPGGSKIKVKNNQDISKGDILAETISLCEHGGEVKYSADLEIKESGTGKTKIRKIVKGKELTIVIASIVPKNASLEQTKKELLWKVDKTGETYVVKSPVDTVVENGMIIAELINEENTVTTSGEIKYAGVEIDENHIITKPGKVIFIPEEIHQISKDSSLKMVESGTYVTAGTEVVKDVRVSTDGIIEIKEYNDIIHEVIVRPGQLHKIDDISQLKVEDGEIINKGTAVAPGIKAKERCMVTFMSSNKFGINEFEMDDIEDEFEAEPELKEEKGEILLRPIQEFDIAPKEVSIKFASTEEELIDITPVTQLQYRDGSRIRNIEGASLTRTSLVLQMQGYLAHLKGLVEFKDKVESDKQNIKIVVLENLIIRREVDNTSREKTSLQTELLVEEGQVIEPKTPVAKTQVLARNNGRVSLKEDKEKEIRRLLLISQDNQEVIKIKSKPIVEIDDFIKIDQVITEGGQSSGISGRVVSFDDKSITLVIGRPYLINPGTQLQVDSESLVQRGDLLATLVFERQKTGDIVQGLPRVEELLEGRKPKESATVAEEDGDVELEYEEDAIRLFIAAETGRHEIKIPVDSNVIVSDKQKITKGQALTDGPLNPHDVIRLRGVAEVQQYLVDEVQRVYRSQGVEIADKHVEVIVRQMTKKVKVDDSGDTNLLPGELVELHTLEAKNSELDEEQIPATYHPVLLGITKASLNTDSFISAASFQETTRVLTEAAVEGKKDQLRGLKENVIIGRLIPAGTGFYHLSHASEEKEEQERQRYSRAAARKPSAILEEIEGLFGSPDFTIE